MNLKWHKRFCKIGLLNITYANKMLTPFLRVIQPFVQVIDGVIGIILLPTPFVPMYDQWIVRRIIKQQCRKKISQLDKTKTK